MCKDVKITAEQLTTALEAWRAAKEEQEQHEHEQEEALFGSEDSLRQANTAKVEEETKQLNKPFAASPKSGIKPEKKA